LPSSGTTVQRSARAIICSSTPRLSGPPVNVVAQENQGVERRGVDGPDQGSQRRRAAAIVRPSVI
jgi:hypothetical protein